MSREEFTSEEQAFLRDQEIVTADWENDYDKHQALARMLQQAHLWGRAKARKERGAE